MRPLPSLHSDKTKHLVCHCAIWGTLISMGFMCLFNMKKFWIASAAAFGAFAFYGLGLSVVQGLPLTPRILLTTISRCGSSREATRGNGPIFKKR